MLSHIPQPQDHDPFKQFNFDLWTPANVRSLKCFPAVLNLLLLVVYMSHWVTSFPCALKVGAGCLLSFFNIIIIFHDFSFS